MEFEKFDGLQGKLKALGFCLFSVGAFYEITGPNAFVLKCAGLWEVQAFLKGIVVCSADRRGGTRGMKIGHTLYPGDKVIDIWGESLLPGQVIKLGKEEIRIISPMTNRTGNSYYVERGVNATTITRHNRGVPIKILCKEAPHA